MSSGLEGHVVLTNGEHLALLKERATLRERVAELERGPTITTEEWACQAIRNHDIPGGVLIRCERDSLRQHLADARVRSESLERQVEEWRERAESADRATIVEHLTDYRAAEIKRLRAAIEAALESFQYGTGAVVRVLRDALGGEKE